ncbi:MAG: aminotransferase class V-fold PLP-dependent enzyme [Clostridiaceae bacterium]|nr:aminotransferase class V-fold PLP-dependent enzyme [Clostridiaceae bacterium]
MEYIKYPEEFRKLIAGIDTKVPLINGKYSTAINFDNAATTPPFLSVLEALMNFSPWYASVHRGAGYKSQLSSSCYEDCREIVGDFVGADMQKHTVIFVKNTTEAINKLSYRLLNKYKKDAVVLSSFMEHHSNDLPWRDKYSVDYVDIDCTGRLSLKDLKEKLIQYKGKVKLVTIAGASNVTGYINPIHEIASLAHEYGAEILVDGAQLVPHAPISMKTSNPSEAIDYLVFSGHKMYAPFGTGVLIGPRETFQEGVAEYVGGGTVELVTHNYIRWFDPPLKEEAGSPNMMGVIALVESIKSLQKLDMYLIDNYEKALTTYTINRLKCIPDIILYGNTIDSRDRLGIVPFNMEGIDHNMLAYMLSYEGGISVRNGCFCAQPYVQRLLNIPDEEIQRRIGDPTLSHPGVVRISFGLYNTHREVDTLISLLKKISLNKKDYIKKYKEILS